MKPIATPRRLAVAALFTLAVSGAAWAQDKPAEAPADAAAAAPERLTPRVGLVDMAYVFKNYRKFIVARESMKTEIAEADLKARRLTTEIQVLQDQLGKLREGSDEHAAADQQLLKLKAEFESFRKSMQREFLRQESQLYKTVYLEASDVIRKLAKEKGYHLVLRFNREDIGAADEPKEVLEELKRSVLYHDPEDDLTDLVLDTLNANYNAEQE